MFEHLNLEFDLQGNMVIAETAAKDYHGVPIYQYVYDSEAHSATEIVSLEEAEIPAAVPQQSATPSETPLAPIGSTDEKQATQTGEVEAVMGGAAAAATVTENVDGEQRVLTLEEQREVAFKVVFFFMMLIAASFAILYIYHAARQSKQDKNSANRKTL